jgi:ATP-dependent Clp protease adapter protein ClpS
MPVSFSPSLEQSLQRTSATAREQHRTHAALEDLLIALIDDADAFALMQALKIDCDRLRRDVTGHIDQAADEATGSSTDVPKYTPELHSVLQRTAIHVQSAGRTMATGADVLVELFTRPVGQFLQGVTRYDAVVHLTQGATTEPTTFPDISGAARLEVFLLNDDYTPMEFVVWILEEVFGIEQDDATKIMLATHHNGRGSCGVFDREEATVRVARVNELAREHRHPLRCLMLPESAPKAP